ncbi:hypothetical protein CLAFUW4_05655 [Fulvia fulva]|uniref:Uncharacterized protein n=1 Tax=Passalora fulva TaxID=5499 RepID=A0A9Q8P8X8_PASFU|nr:uncharacterized protein CLAFUR5_05796 [Fulvia fulva]UJO17371.1 hypothetical protein CLAFUR5_05796 [Fulvia fulva]WPV15554.1 hypothetical protein CLAFUW4_05655 [Fulvia fulva]WPV30528.1 hypothetical protein CLAFUW7_05654 [Fulvia fulva]
MSATKGNWQSAGTLIVTPKGNDELFDTNEMSDFFGSSFVTNTTKSDSAVEVKQALSVLTKNANGTTLPPPPPKAGSCKIVKIPKCYLTLQDARVSDNGEMVYKFLVGEDKTPDGMLAGVQLQVFKGTGQAMPGSGAGGANTFFFQIK